MLTGLVMAAGFCEYIAATWMYGQKEDQAYAISSFLYFKLS